jgi:hypothetical protein
MEALRHLSLGWNICTAKFLKEFQIQFFKMNLFVLTSATDNERMGLKNWILHGEANKNEYM